MPKTDEYTGITLCQVWDLHELCTRHAAIPWSWYFDKTTGDHSTWTAPRFFPQGAESVQWVSVGPRRQLGWLRHNTKSTVPKLLAADLGFRNFLERPGPAISWPERKVLWGSRRMSDASSKVALLCTGPACRESKIQPWSKSAVVCVHARGKSLDQGKTLHEIIVWVLKLCIMFLKVLHSLVLACSCFY
jgi:hypothetical protein